MFVRTLCTVPLLLCLGSCFWLFRPPLLVGGGGSGRGADLVADPDAAGVLGYANWQDDGEPAEAIGVVLRSVDDATFERTATTDDEGAFQLRRIPPGTYVLITPFGDGPRMELRVGTLHVEKLALVRAPAMR